MTSNALLVELRALLGEQQVLTEGDLSACEAVARAVQLAEVLALGRDLCHAEVEDQGLTSHTARREPRPPVGKDARPGRSWALLALTGVAALLAVGVFAPRDEPRVAAPEPSVVGIWADSWHTDFDAETAPAEATTEVAQTADTQDLVAPGWLLAAVNGNAAAAANVDEADASTERQEN